MSLFFKKKVLTIFQDIKNNKIFLNIEIKDKYKKCWGKLVPITFKDIHNKKIIKQLNDWRKENSFAFVTQFKVTLPKTEKWLKAQLLDKPSRILFMIETTDRISVGHIGLYSFNYKEESCEIDNVIRGEKQVAKGIMTHALNTLILWTKKTFKPKNIYLKVLTNNQKAINFYKINNFINYQLLPLKRKPHPEMEIWSIDRRLKKAKKYFIKMIYKK